MNYQEWIVTNSRTVQIVFFYGMLVVLVTLEILVPVSLRPPDRFRRWRSNFLLPIISLLLLAALPLTGLGVSAWAARKGFGLLNRVALPAEAVLFLTALLRSFSSWALHLAMHKAPLLWRVHRTHHLDENMDVSTTVRFHPLEYLMSLLVAMATIALFGLPVWALVVYEVLETAVRLFSHANIRLPRVLEKTIRLILSTPDFHRLHHSVNRAETDSNYGAIFSFWDRWFGTYRPSDGKDLARMRLGLEENEGEKTQSLWWLLRNPFL